MKIIFNNEKLQTLYEGTFKGKPTFAFVKPIVTIAPFFIQINTFLYKNVPS
jgi:hypothetical protein